MPATSPLLNQKPRTYSEIMIGRFAALVSEGASTVDLLEEALNLTETLAGDLQNILEDDSAADAILAYLREAAQHLPYARRTFESEREEWAVSYDNPAN